MRRRILLGPFATALFTSALLAGHPASAQQNVPAALPPPAQAPPHTAPQPKPGTTARPRRGDILIDIAEANSLATVEAEQRAAKPRPQTAGTSGGASALNPTEERDPSTVAEFLRAQRAYYRFRAESYAFSLRVFEWQRLSSQIIFAVVMALVLAGLYFSWLQFREDARRRALFDRLRSRGRAPAVAVPAAAARTPTAEGGATPDSALRADAGPPAAPDEERGQSHLKLSAQGIEVSSSVLGIVILVVSLGFFYLYLVHVYPITEVK
jgi:hypothetical protein